MNSFFFLKIAASMVVLLGLGFGIYSQFGSDTVDPDVVNVENTAAKIQSLGDVSPDLKKVENYYLASY